MGAPCLPQLTSLDITPHHRDWGAHGGTPYNYQGGEHTEDSFDYHDSVDYFNRMIAWFDKYLKAP